MRHIIFDREATANTNFVLQVFSCEDDEDKRIRKLDNFIRLGEDGRILLCLCDSCYLQMKEQFLSRESNLEKESIDMEIKANVLDKSDEDSVRIVDSDGHLLFKYNPLTDSIEIKSSFRSGDKKIYSVEIFALRKALKRKVLQDDSGLEEVVLTNSSSVEEVESHEETKSGNNNENVTENTEIPESEAQKDLLEEVDENQE